MNALGAGAPAVGVVMLPIVRPLAAIDRARIEVARVRGWTSRGAHDRAAQALDAALRALSEADAVLHAAPCAAAAAMVAVLTTVRLDLDRVTGGA